MILDSFINKSALAPRTERSNPTNRHTVFMPRTNSGIFVNEDTALKYSAVFSAVRLLSETVGSLPWQELKRLDSGDKEIVTDTNVARIIGKRPNEETYPFTFKETLMAHATMWGNGYAEIERNMAGEPLAMWVITPNRVTVRRNSNRDIIYEISNNRQDNTVIAAKNMFHLRGLGFDGVVGYSVIAHASQSIGLGIATEVYGSSFFGNSSIPSGVLKYPEKLSEEAKKNLKNSFEDAHRGVNRGSVVAVLEEGLDYKSIGIPPEDAQFLETRRFQVTDIARWFRVPPHMIGDLEKSSFNNIEEQSKDFVTNSIVSWALRFEQEADIKLLSSNRAGRFFTKMNLNGLLRGDTQSRFEGYAIGRQWGWLSVNEIRRFEDMNSLPGDEGNQYLMPTNMTTSEKFLEEDDEEETEQPVDEAENNDVDVDETEGEEETTEDEGLSTTKASYKHLLVECMERILRRESHRVDVIQARAGGSKDRFVGEIDAFYVQHHEYMDKELCATISSILASCPSPGGEKMRNDMTNLAIGFYVQRHMEQSKCDILAAYDDGDTSAWKNELRPGESADYLIDKVIDAGLMAECMK